MSPLRSPVPRSFLIGLLGVAALGMVALACDPAAAAPHRARARRHAAPVAVKTIAARPVAAQAVTAQPVAARPASPLVLPLGAAGMIVAIEPETGALVRPTPEQVLQLLPGQTSRLTPAERTGLMRTSEGLTETQLKDGSVMVDLQGRFQEFEIVRLDAQGRPHYSSTNDAATARRLLDPATPAPTPNAEEK